mgnify:CR=1 FL=1
MRKYQHGLDRGRVYIQNSRPLPWTGLVQVEDKRTNVDVIPLYDDGIKYDLLSEAISTGVKINCYNYPSALDGVTGFALDDHGILYDEQPLGFFSFAYRSMTDTGYKIIVVFNVMAVPGNVVHETVEDAPHPTMFSFDGEAVPIVSNGRIVSRIELDTDRVSKSLMEAFLKALDNAPMSKIIKSLYTFKTERDLIDKLRTASR